ncbi:MAG: hypothetical protein F6K24_35925, partial [Okeania sp. SIO2D1]|nr:hypothetical protein [Okeania sp. SIO2D1]
DLTNIDGTLYFRAFDGTNGTELWKSDGTPDGTVLVKDILPGSSDSFPDNLTNIDGTLYFRADNGTNGTELWKLGESNNPPTDITLANNNINENVAANSVVGTLTTTDPDDPDSQDSYTYELVAGDGDTDNAAFTIGGTNNDQLLINSSPDYETQSSYNIRVQTTDAAGATYQEQLTINVNDLDETPTMEGTPGRDIFRGANTAENYSALDGHDRVYGNGGADNLNGGNGNDIIYGGNDDDTLDGGVGHDRLNGDNGDDELFGNEGNDILNGGAGDDILDGGLGSDRYNGGAGADTFIIGPGMGVDLIQRFEDGTDIIQLEGGIGFDDLDIVRSGSSTLIKVDATGELLARLSGINVDNVGADDFTESVA